MKKANFKVLQRVVTENGAEAMVVAIKPDDPKPYRVVFTHPERHGIKRPHNSLTEKRMNELFGAVA